MLVIAYALHAAAGVAGHVTVEPTVVSLDAIAAEGVGIP
jgi:hypothetical protein